MNRTIHRLIRLSLPGLLGLVLLSGPRPADAGREVHTDTSRVHACLPTGDVATRAPSGPGFLAATDGGLVRVGADGGIQAVWTALDGLPGTRVRAITRDGDTWWIGTESGLAHARVRGDRLEILATRRSKPIHALLRHGDSLYVGTWGDGVKRMKQRATGAWGPLATIHVTGERHRARARISDLVVHDGVVVAATAGSGLFALRGRRMRAMGGALSNAMVWSVESHGGALWVGTVDGLHVVRDGATRRIGDGDIRHVDASGQGRDAVRVATFGTGVRGVRGERLTGVRDIPTDVRFVHAYTRESNTRACIATHQGLWVETEPGRWTKAEVTGPPSGDISALAIFGDQLWVGTFDHGLAVYQGGRWHAIDDPGIDHNINGLAVSDERLWIATSAGLSVLPLRAADAGRTSEGKNPFRGIRAARLDRRDGLPSRHILSVAALRDGGVVVGTTRGAVTIHDDRITVLGSKQGLAVKNVWAVAEGDDGWLWLGTTKGLYRARPGDGWRRFSVASGHLRDDWVMALSVAHGSVWVGTYKGGVSRLTVDASTNRSNGDEPTAGDYRATVVGDGWINPGGLAWHGDTLYAATMEGLFIGDGTTWIERRGEREGLAAPGRDTTCVIAQESPVQSDGSEARRGPSTRLWVASRRGLVVMDPSH